MPTTSLDAFLARWSLAGGGEMANSQTYLSELCDALGVARPQPFTSDASKHDYVFEHRVEREFADGTRHTLRIDLYKKGHFVLESKQGASPKAAEPEFTLSAPTPQKKGIGLRGTDTWRAAMVRAKVQAEGYARDLPQEHGWPPFLVVVDVGYCIELWANFARDGKAYTQFPDRNRFRIFHNAEDAKGAPTLRDPEVRALLAKVWQEPMALDPSRYAAEVTRKVAKRLALLSKALESGPKDATSHWQQKDIAEFLMRCMFTMFAEDVGLLPKGVFTKELESRKGKLDTIQRRLEGIWRVMDKGGYSPELDCNVRTFNGGLFHDARALPLTAEQLELLIDAAKAEWSHVEPAIFGTLMEGALSTAERHQLGAHYTPRSYVERLVMPTVIEPLRADWLLAQKEAQLYEMAGKPDAALLRIEAFHQALCKVRVLDPACGSGNFLYVALDLMKRLEGEVLQQIADYRAGDKAGHRVVKEGTGEAVHPRQFWGIEVNTRAAVIAEMVLWIGYLQWEARAAAATKDEDVRRKLAEKTVLEDLHRIENRDAVLAWDSRKPKLDADGKPVTVWDGVSTKKHPVTGLEVPDESKRTVVEEILGAKKAEWPEAEFVVGNPPFIGSKRMRAVLGDGYVDALQAAWPEVAQATDYVTRWWCQAADLLRDGAIRRFGFITTNSLSQSYVRRAIEGYFDGNMSLAYAVPDHPWVDTTDGAAVRIAMTVAVRGDQPGRLVLVREESATSGRQGDDLVVGMSERVGRLHADLSIGADVVQARPLAANGGLCAVGFKTIGGAFQIAEVEAIGLGLGSVPDLDRHIRPYFSGRDFVDRSRGLFVIDFFGLEAEAVRNRFPGAYQHLLTKAKPERDQNRNPMFRATWWIIGHPRPAFRAFSAGLSRYIATVETAKHRVFAFVPAHVAPDSTLVTFGSDDAAILGILSSRTHVVWALAAGSRLGVGNDPRYNKTLCFEKFPFPAATPAQEAVIRDLGERLDAHRKRQQALHADLTLTGMYNVLQKLRSGEALSAKEKVIHEQGLCSVLKQLHDELDAAVFAAYGWPADLSDEELLQKLVDLNAERAEEERLGLVRWLRPEFQHPTAKAEGQKQGLDLGFQAEGEGEEAVVQKRLPWPTKTGEKFAALDQVLGQAKAPVSVDEVVARFDGVNAQQVEALLRAVASVGGCVEVEGKWVSGA